MKMSEEFNWLIDTIQFTTYEWSVFYPINKNNETTNN